MPNADDEIDEYDDDFDDEAVGSCEECGTDLYASEDVGTGLCDQCQWALDAAGFMDGDEEE